MSGSTAENAVGRSDWETLLSQAQRDEAPALSELLLRVAVTLRPILQYRLRGWSQQDYDDILQETLIALAGKLKQIEAAPQRYAAGILKNKIGDALRARDRRSEFRWSGDDSEAAGPWRHEVENVLRQPSPEPELLGRIDNDELIERVRAAISQLSLFCQTFFVGILEGQEMPQLWELFRCAEPALQRNTFRKRVFDCRMKLKALLQGAI